MTSVDGSGDAAPARGGSSLPLSGGSGHHARRHYDRCVGVPCHSTGTEERGITPADITSQEAWPGPEPCRNGVRPARAAVERR